MMDECCNSPNNFIQGIDSSSNLAFLLFVLTPFCTQLRLWITVAVIFSDTGIKHTIIADFETKRVRKIKPHWGSVSIQNLVHFMENGELKNDLGYQPITRWIHLKGKSKGKACGTKLKIAIILIHILLAAIILILMLWNAFGS